MIRSIALFTMMMLCTLSAKWATINLSVTDNYENGKNYSYSPGDTLLLEPGRRPMLHLKHFHGTASSPLVVMNGRGVVRIGKMHYYGFTMDSCSYIHVTGTGDPSTTYGIVVDGTAAGVGFGIGGLSTDIEVDHMEICSTGFAGIMAKQDFGGTPPSPVPVFSNLSIHDNYIHDVGGEGMYIGETKSPGMEFRHVKIFNNLVVRSGWDCFQIANAVEDVEVYNNVFYLGGLEKKQYHGNGIQLGDNTVGSYYNNIIMHVPANGLIIMGSGDIQLFDNYIQGTGASALFIDNRDFTLDNTSIVIEDNYMCDINRESTIFGVYNELNSIEFRGNVIEGANDLVRYASGAGPQNVSFEDTTRTSVSRIGFVDSAADDFRLPVGSPYMGLGLIGQPVRIGTPQRRGSIVGLQLQDMPPRVFFTVTGRKIATATNQPPANLGVGVFVNANGTREIHTDIIFTSKAFTKPFY